MKTRLLRAIPPALGGLSLLGVTLFIALRWQRIPDSIPTHFDAAGVATSFGGKSSLWTLLIVAWLCFGCMAVCRNLPQTWSVPVRGARSLRATAWIMDLLTLVVALMFAYMTLCSALCRPLGAWFLPVTLAACFLPILLPVVASLRK